MRILLLFIFAFSSFVCFGQTESKVDEMVKTFKGVTQSGNGSKVSVGHGPTREDTENDYLTPCSSSLTKMFWDLEGWVTIDTFFLYQAWIAKELNKNFKGRNYLDIRLGGEYKYYFHFIENNDTVQILKVPGVHFWHDNSDSIELKSEYFYFVLDKKLHAKVQKVCAKAVGEANYSKQRSKGLCSAMQTTISTNYKSAYYTCTTGYKTYNLAGTIDFGIAPMLLKLQTLDLQKLHKWTDNLMQYYELE